PVLGGEPRLVTEHAAGPAPLPDGSLIVVRINAARQWQLHRYWPDSARLQPLPALIGSGPHFVSAGVRARPDGKEVMFTGRRYLRKIGISATICTRSISVPAGSAASRLRLISRLVRIPTHSAPMGVM